MTYSGDNYSYTISDTDAAFPTVKAYADVAANGLKLTAVANTNKYNVSIGTEFSAASFAQHLKANVGSLGTGTAIFVALGALAVICAGVFLVTNKRMSKESF